MKIHNPMRVDQIVPIFNGEKFIHRYFQSFFNSEDSKIVRLVVVDNCSTDNSLKLASSYLRPGVDLIIQNETNIGLRPSVEGSLPYLTADYCFYQSIDDLQEPGFISAAVDALDKRRDAVYCFGRSKMLIYDQSGSLVGVKERFCPYTFDVELSYASLRTYFCNFPTDCAITRREALVKLGGFWINGHWKTGLQEFGTIFFLNRVSLLSGKFGGNYSAFAGVNGEALHWWHSDFYRIFSKPSRKLAELVAGQVAMSSYFSGASVLEVFEGTSRIKDPVASWLKVDENRLDVIFYLLMMLIGQFKNSKFSSDARPETHRGVTYGTMADLMCCWSLLSQSQHELFLKVRNYPELSWLVR